jgi:primosomal replication protein N
MEHTANQITLRGELAQLPVFSHENHGRRFFAFPLRVERLSGASDVLDVIVPEQTMETVDLSGGEMLEIVGQLRSFNNRMGVGRKLIISVYAEQMQTTSGAPDNQVQLEGAICKQPVFRRTPLGREICDVMLAVNRPYHRADYLPCILWGRTAREIASLPVGARLRVTGRLQSREYIKLLDTGSEKRTAFEVSVVTAEQLAQTADEPNCVPV